MIAIRSSCLFALVMLAPIVETGMPDLQRANLWKPFTITERQQVLKIIRSPDGRYFTAGNTYTKESGSHFWIGELDNAGKKLWGKSFEAKNQKKINDIVVTDDQHLLLVGQQYAAGYQGWIAKFTLDGKLIFEQILGAPATRDLTTLSIALPTNENCHVLAGRSRSDAYLVKINQSGKVIWEKRFDHYRDDWILSGVATVNDTFVFASLCGELNKFGKGESKVWIIECDTEGNLLREFSTSGQISPETNSIATVGDRLYLGLSSHQPDPKGCFPLQSNCWALCLDSRLKEKWRSKYGEQQLSAHTPAIYKLPNENLLLCWTNDRKLALWCINNEGKLLAEEKVPASAGNESNRTEGLVVERLPNLPKLFVREIELMPNRSSSKPVVEETKE